MLNKCVPLLLIIVCCAMVQQGYSQTWKMRKYCISNGGRVVNANGQLRGTIAFAKSST